MNDFFDFHTRPTMTFSSCSWPRQFHFVALRSEKPMAPSWWQEVLSYIRLIYEPWSSRKSPSAPDIFYSATTNASSQQIFFSGWYAVIADPPDFSTPC